MCKCEFYDDSIELTFLRLFCFMLIFWVCTYDFILDIRGQKYSLAGQINIIWIIIIEIILTTCVKMPTPLRTPQTSGHSSFRVSNLPLWSLKSPPSHGSKIIFFHLSQSKCTVSALFLHGFKGCNGYSDLQNTTKGAEIAGQKITMLCAKTT